VSRLEGSGWLVLYKVISITAPTNPSNFNFQNLKWSGKMDLRDGRECPDCVQFEKREVVFTPTIPE
jgi:hypothetical protein